MKKAWLWIIGGMAIAGSLLYYVSRSIVKTELTDNPNLQTIAPPSGKDEAAAQSADSKPHSKEDILKGIQTEQERTAKSMADQQAISQQSQQNSMQSIEEVQRTLKSIQEINKINQSNQQLQQQMRNRKN